jgi:hypothetical protein
MLRLLWLLVNFQGQMAGENNIESLAEKMEEARPCFDDPVRSGGFFE